MNDMSNIDMIARTMNYELHAEQFDIPMFNFMTREKNDNPQIIFIATGNNFIEQLVSDGPIKDGEFESRIDLVISNVKKASVNIETNFYHYRDYSNGIFNYKLYFQDMIIPTNEGKKIIRTINAFFVEPKMHDFYQFSLSVGPYDMSTETLKPGVFDLENDKITLTLSNYMKELLDNLKYKN